MSNSNVQIQPQSLEDYLGLKYAITLIPEAEGGYTALIADLPGCMTQGETLQEAIDNLKEAQQVWIETALEFGDQIPLPTPQSPWRSSGSV